MEWSGKNFFVGMYGDGDETPGDGQGWVDFFHLFSMQLSGTMW